MSLNIDRGIDWEAVVNALPTMQYAVATLDLDASVQVTLAGGTQFIGFVGETHDPRMLTLYMHNPEKTVGHPFIYTYVDVAQIAAFKIFPAKD